MNLAALRSTTYGLLGTDSKDKFYPAATVDLWLNAAADAVMQRVKETAPDIYRKVATLAAASATSRTYALGTQGTPITDFAGVLALRLVDVDGAPLTLVRDEELDSAAGAYSVIGLDEAATITTSADIAAGSALWLKYSYWPAQMDDDTDEPGGVPERFHPLIAFEAAETLFTLGDEQAMPGDMKRIQVDWDARLLLHVSRRSRDLLSVRGSDNTSGYAGAGL